MSAFLTTLRVEWVTCPANKLLKNRDGRQLYRVIEPFMYQSDVAKATITVPAGFITDLASIPRLPFFYRALEQVADMPGVIHDYLYSVGPPPRQACDEVLREACLLIGLSSWKVWAIYSGVRVGGKSRFMVK